MAVEERQAEDENFVLAVVGVVSITIIVIIFVIMVGVSIRSIENCKLACQLTCAICVHRLWNCRCLVGEPVASAVNCVRVQGLTSC